MDLKLKEVAELLNVSEATVRRWLTDGLIPSYKINNQHRFNRSEIEDWVMKNKLKNEEGVSPFSQNTKATSLSLNGGQKQYSLYRALHKGGVFTAPSVRTKEEFITKAAKIIANNLDSDSEVLNDLLLDREKLQSTALGNGIAVPHTRDFLLEGGQDSVTLVFPKTPLDWNALDGKPVSACFFLFAADDARHLHLLAKIAFLSSLPQALELFAQRPSLEKTLEFIKNWEGSIRGSKTPR